MSRLRTVLALAALATLPYLNAIPGDFVFDDVGVIRDNPRVMGPRGSAAELLTYVHRPGELYRPVTMLTYRANAVAAPSPRAFHAVNVALHAAVTILLFSVVSACGADARLAFPAAALFAVHPVHTEAVTNIVGRAELLAAAAVLVSLLCAAAAARSSRPPWRWHLAAAGTALLGCLCKENAFAAFVLAPMGCFHFRKRRWRLGDAAALWPYAAGAAAFVALRLAVLGSLRLPYRPTWVDNPLAHLLPWERIATALVIVWHNLALLVLPLRLSADYSFNQVPPVTEITDPRLWGAAAILGALLLLVVAARRRVPMTFLGALFFCVTLAPTSNIPFPIGTIQAERLLYLPSAGFCLAAAELLCLGVARGGGRRPRRAVVALWVALLLAYGARTWARNPDWRSERALWEATVRTAPNSAKAHYNLGAVLEREGELSRAQAEYRRALAIFPYHGAAKAALGRLHMRAGRYREGLKWVEEGLAEEWTDAGVHFTAGIFWYGQGAFDTAEAAYRTAIAIDRSHARARLGLAVTSLAKGRFWRALLQAERAERLVSVADEESSRLLFEIGATLRSKGFRAPALERWTQRN